MIRSTVAAVPHREPVLIAKALVFTATAFIVSAGSAFAAFLLGQQALTSTHLKALSTPSQVGLLDGVLASRHLILNVRAANVHGFPARGYPRNNGPC